MLRRDFASEINEQLTTQEVIEHYGFEPDRSNSICCPFHKENHPSLHIYPNGWYCFGCGKGGGAINFVMELFHIPFAMAIRRINDDFCLGLFDDRKLHPVINVEVNREFDTETKELIKRYEDNVDLLATKRAVIDTAVIDSDSWAEAVRSAGRLRLETESLWWDLFVSNVRKGDNGSGETVWYRWRKRG